MSTTNIIDAVERTVKNLLNEQKYSIDFYQREYSWQTKQVQELLEDLEAKFLVSYREHHTRDYVRNYGQYFLGSIVVTQKMGRQAIVDGQQRLTTLTLLLIYLNNLQIEKAVPEDDRVSVSPLIYSTQYGARSFNLDVPDRTECMNALFAGKTFVPGENISVRNLLERYQDVKRSFLRVCEATPFPILLIGSSNA